MQLLFNGEWIEAPAPTPVSNSVALAVEATVPISDVRGATGRVIRAPYRKALRFAVLDGPARTLAKVRSKREEARLQGDYRIVAAIGRQLGDGAKGAPATALCLRSAASAEVMLGHSDLVFEQRDASAETLRRFAGALAEQADRIAELTTQSFLYSGERPPRELRQLAATAASAAAGAERVPPGSALELLCPPRRAGAPLPSATVRLQRPRPVPGLPVALLGGGDYARTQILPAIERAGLRPYALADREPQIAAEVGRAAGFALATTDAPEAVESLPERGLVVIATAHDSHAPLAAGALDAGHRVFVEKPAVVTRADLDLLTAAVARNPGRLDVGFNRRHHPLATRLRESLAAEAGPLTITCLVREISLSPSHWYLWPNQGTRVAGNLCHWIDLGVSLLDPAVQAVDVSVSPPLPPSAGSSSIDAERVVSISFSDGSLLTVVATDRGDDLRGVQETIDARRGMVSARIDDFRSLTVLRNGRSRHAVRLWRDKGHRRMFATCFRRAARSAPAFYPAADLERVGTIQIAASELIAGGGARDVTGPASDRPIVQTINGR